MAHKAPSQSAIKGNCATAKQAYCHHILAAGRHSNGLLFHFRNSLCKGEVMIFRECVDEPVNGNAGALNVFMHIIVALICSANHIIPAQLRIQMNFRDQNADSTI